MKLQQKNYIPLEEKKKIKFNNNNIIQNVINFSVIQNIKKRIETEKDRNVPHLYPINYEEINSEKYFNETPNNSNPKESNIIQAITDNTQSSSIKNNYIIKQERFFTEKILIKNNNFNPKDNNEIKVFKNNKFVYLNKNLLNSYSTSRAIKTMKKINFITRKKRSSKYRGVSKNGSKWQVLMMINNKKCYLGNYPSEDLAARIYDIQAIKSWGINARTNFAYDSNQIKKIYNKKINFNCNNISDIMTQINN